MKRMLWRVSLVALVSASLACSLINSVTGGGDANLTSASDLWSDVPRMDGLTPSQMDMPLYAKVLMRTMMKQILGGGTDSGDWIVFTTDQTPEDITAFYTNERMAENGWEPSDNSTCLNGSAQGLAQVGAFCVFQKQNDTKYTGLMIIAAQDEKAKQTNVIFIRVQVVQTPTPGQ